MSTKRTPVQVVRDEHGGKEKLVEKILGLIERGEDNVDELKGKLLKVSNQQLLRLAKTAEIIKSKYGSKDQLVTAVAGALGRAKDSDFAKRLGKYTPGRLLDMAQALAKKGKTAPAKKTPAAKRKA